VESFGYAVEKRSWTFGRNFVFCFKDCVSSTLYYINLSSYAHYHQTEPEGNLSTDIHRLTTWIRSEKCLVRRFRRCANVIKSTCTKLDSITYYTFNLYIAYFS
jgi:hypothetical protein